MLDVLQTEKPLRVHQVKALDLLRERTANSLHHQKYPRVMLEAPTGFGKTRLATEMVGGFLKRDLKVLVTVPLIKLSSQWMDTMYSSGIHAGLLQSTNSNWKGTEQVCIATLQTLMRKEDKPQADVVFVDEAHMKSDMIKSLIELYPNAWFYGLSATPWAKGMGNVWNDLVKPITTGDLIEQGYLSKYTVYAPDNPDMAGVTISQGDYSQSGAAKVMSEVTIVSNIIEQWYAKGEARPTLLFSPKCAHAKIMADRFNAAGVAAGYVDARVPLPERESMAEQFREGAVKIICSVRTMTEGVDLPVGCVIDAAPTCSQMLHVQKIGRGLRVNPGTEDLIILDHAGNTHRNGFVEDVYFGAMDTSEKGEKAERPKKKKEPRECPKCEKMFSGVMCASCGHKITIPPGVKVIDGELVEITDYKPSEQYKRQWYAEMCGLLISRGKNEKRVYHLFRDKFGELPKNYRVSPQRPSQDVINFLKHQNILYAKRMEKANA